MSSSMNLNTSVQSGMGSVNVGQAIPTEQTAPAVPATTLGPVDTTSTAAGQPAVAVAYNASSQAPVLSSPVVIAASTQAATHAQAAQVAAATSYNSSDTSTTQTNQSTGEPGATTEQQADAGTQFAPVTTNQDNSQSGDGDSGSGNPNAQTDATVVASTTTEGEETVDGANSAVKTTATAALDPSKLSTTASDLEALLEQINNGTLNIDPSAYTTNPDSFNAIMGNTLTSGLEIINSQMAALQALPDSPEKVQMMDYLKAVSEAIVELQEMIKTIQATDSESSRDRTQAQLDSNLAKAQIQLDAIKEQAEEQAKSAKKEKALEKVGLSSQAINIIIMVVMVIVAIPAIIAAGPVGGAIIAAFIIACLVDMIMKTCGVDGVFDNLATGLGKMTIALIDSCEETFNITVDQRDRDIACLVMKVVVTAAIIAGVVIASPSTALLVCSSGISSMISACDIGSESARLAGASESTQSWAEFGVTCATIVITAVGSWKSGGLAVAEDVVGVTSKLAQNALNIAAQFGRRGATIAMDVGVSLTTAGLETGNAVVNYQLQNIYADMATIQADADAEVAIKDALIKVLKDIIKKLQDAITGFGDFLGTLNTMQENVYKNLSANALTFPG